MGYVAESLTVSRDAERGSNRAVIAWTIGRIAAAAVGGALYGLGARPGGWPVVIVAMAVFIEVTAGAPSAEAAALLGATWAVAGALVAFTWLVSTGIAVYLVVAVGWGAAGLAAGGAFGLVGTRSWRYFAAPLVIAAWETLRVAITNGTALAIAPTALVGTPLLGAAAWVGATGLTVALGALAAAAWGIARRERRMAAWLFTGALALLAPALVQPPLGTLVRVGAVQTWMTNKDKWDPAKLTSVLADLERLTVTSANRGAQLVVWPETAVPQDPFHDPVARAAIIEAARKSKAWIIAGTETLVPPFAGAPPTMWRPANLLLLVDPQGQPRGAHTKMHHVPYGEPAEARGPGYRILQWGSTPIGPMISWEVFTSAPFRAYARQGAELAVAPTNTAWAAARMPDVGEQEIALARVRAAESRLPIVLAANGPAAVIDGHGGILARGRTGQTEAVVGSVRAGGGTPGPFADGVGQVAGVAALPGIVAWGLQDPRRRWVLRARAPVRWGWGLLAGAGGTAALAGMIAWAEWMMSMLLGAPRIPALLTVGVIGGVLAWGAYGPLWGWIEARWGPSAAFALGTAVLWIIAGLLPVEGMDWVRVATLWTGMVRLVWGSPWGPAVGAACASAILPVVAPR